MSCSALSLPPTTQHTIQHSLTLPNCGIPITCSGDVCCWVMKGFACLHRYPNRPYKDSETELRIPSKLHNIYPLASRGRPRHPSLRQASGTPSSFRFDSSHHLLFLSSFSPMLTKEALYNFFKWVTSKRGYSNVFQTRICVSTPSFVYGANSERIWKLSTTTPGYSRMTAFLTASSILFSAIFGGYQVGYGGSWRAATSERSKASKTKVRWSRTF